LLVFVNQFIKKLVMERALINWINKKLHCSKHLRLW